VSSPTLGQLLFSFFEDHLKCQKGLRPSSIKSYRDTMKLFIQFVAEDAHQRLSRLSVADLTCERVRSFLKALEDKRHNHIRTRNQRLAALRTFFEYVAQRLPEALKEAGRIAAIPTKRAAPPETRFLKRDEIEALFRSLPSSGGAGLRDRALLLFLYNTGARVQEVAELCVKNLELGPAPRVHLHGKGDKWRTCPLWKETAQLLQKLLADHPTSNAQGHVFTSAQGRPLTRFGIYKIVCRHTRKLPQLQTGHGHRGISPHVFRHSTAAHLLESGVELNVIRAWLGHVSLATTNRYAEINLRMKQAALDACQPPISAATETFPRRPIWRDDAELLKWLKSI
jgi:site-specific recombinase XerD